MFGDNDEVSDLASRLDTLEESVQRIEKLLEKFVGGNGGDGGGGGGGAEEDEEEEIRAGVQGERFGRRATLVELNREAEEE